MSEIKSLCSVDMTGRRSSEPHNHAIVVFAGSTSLKWLHWLRPGYRHCFVAIAQRDVWIICDPLSHRTDLIVVCGHTREDLVAWYRQHGLTVVETRVRRAPRRPAPIRPFSCVEAVKRILGIHAPWVLTPWQLYQHLSTQT